MNKETPASNADGVDESSKKIKLDLSMTLPQSLDFLRGLTLGHMDAFTMCSVLDTLTQLKADLDQALKDNDILEGCNDRQGMDCVKLRAEVERYTKLYKKESLSALIAKQDYDNKDCELERYIVRNKALLSENRKLKAENEDMGKLWEIVKNMRAHEVRNDTACTHGAAWCHYYQEAKELVGGPHENLERPIHDALAKVKEFITHKPDCGYAASYEGGCDCGMDELLAEMEPKK